MTRQIVLEGSKEEIAKQILETTDSVVRAVLVVDTPVPARSKNGSPGTEDQWTKELRQWAASHKPLTNVADDGRESIYKDYLQ